MDWLSNIGPILSGSGLSFGGLLVALIIMFARGMLWTKPQVERVISNLEKELSRSNTDRDYWRDSYFDQKQRADKATDTLIRTVPLIGVTNKALDTLNEKAEGGMGNGSG